MFGILSIILLLVGGFLALRVFILGPLSLFEIGIAIACLAVIIGFVIYGCFPEKND